MAHKAEARAGAHGLHSFKCRPWTIHSSLQVYQCMCGRYSHCRPQAQEVVEQVKEKLTAAFDVTWAQPSMALSLDSNRHMQTLKVTQALIYIACTQAWPH